MKRKYVFQLLFVFAVAAFLIISCKKEDNPVVTPTPKNGNFRVFVRNGANWFVGANVQVFLSDADRTTGNAFRSGVTTLHSSGDTSKYVQFDTLPYAKYYLKATYNDTATSLFYIGTEDLGKGVWAFKDSTVKIHIFVIP